MNPTEPVREFLTDLTRLPLIVKLFVLYGIGAAGWNWWKARQQAQVIAASAVWPVYKARVVWAQVSDWHSEGEDGPTYLEGVLTYSYTVPGHDLEVGEYRKRFDDEDEAGTWARALRDTFVDVRVDPADVTRSIWQETANLAIPSALAPQFGGSSLNELEAWGSQEVLATAVFCVAAAGAFLAAWIQLSCLMGKPLISEESNEVAFFGMHIGAIVCWITVALVAQRGKGSRSAWQKSFKAGTTGIAMKVLGLYTTVVFLYGWVRMAAHDGDSRLLGTLMFSAIWLIFFVGAATNALQAMQHRGSDAG